MTIPLPQNDWQAVLKDTFQSSAVQSLFYKVDSLYQSQTVLPEKSSIFKAFDLSSYQNTKVVILGQDPYPNPANAMGLSFSVKPGVQVPKSLQNIYKEQAQDLGITQPNSGDLTPWAKQGVLLLNTTLTVQAGYSQSHSQLGWQQLTGAAIEALNKRDQPLVFILWGQAAGKFAKNINSKHLVIQSAHPSPLSAYRGFFGSKPFSRANAWLVANHEEPIDWQL